MNELSHSNNLNLSLKGDNIFKHEMRFSAKNRDSLIEYISSKESVFDSIKALSPEGLVALMDFSNSRATNFRSFLQEANQLPIECKLALEGLIFRNGYLALNFISLLQIDFINDIIGKCISEALIVN